MKTTIIMQDDTVYEVEYVERIDDAHHTRLKREDGAIVSLTKSEIREEMEGSKN